MPDDSISLQRRISAIEAQLHDNIAQRGQQEQEFTRLLTARMAEVLDEFRDTVLREADDRAERERLRHVDLQRQIDARFDNFGLEIDIIRDTHILTQSVGNDVSKLIQEVQTLRSAQVDLSTEFRQIGERQTDLEARMDQSEEDRRVIHRDLQQAARANADMARAVKRVEDRLEGFIERIETLIAQGLTPDQSAAAVGFLDLLRAERGMPPIREAGDGG